MPAVCILGEREGGDIRIDSTRVGLESVSPYFSGLVWGDCDNLCDILGDILGGILGDILGDEESVSLYICVVLEERTDSLYMFALYNDSKYSSLRNFVSNDEVSDVICFCC